jgi:aubergine-like protein
MTKKPDSISDRTMIIGIDVYNKLIHNKCCYGFVASLDPQFTQFFSKVIIQKPADLMNDLNQCIKEAVTAFFNFNDKKFLPETIIIFRDGVGEG